MESEDGEIDAECDIFLEEKSNYNAAEPLEMTKNYIKPYIRGRDPYNVILLQKRFPFWILNVLTMDKDATMYGKDNFLIYCDYLSGRIGT